MRSVGFGFERLALPAVAHPRAALALVILLSALAVSGAAKLRLADDPIALFRGDARAYQTYAAFREHFADPALFVAIAVQGDFEQPNHWQALRDVDRALGHTLGADRVASIFDIERIERAAGPPVGDVLFGDTPAAAEEARGVLGPAALAAHPLNVPRLLDADLTTAAILVALPAEEPSLQAARAVRDAAEPLLARLPAEMTATLTGLPITRLEIASTIWAQQPLLLGTGLVIGFVLGVFLLGRLADAVVVAVVPVLTILGLYGVLGHLGIAMTVLVNNLPLLVLALAFTTSLHLVHASRRDLHAADYAIGALRATMLRVGPTVFLSASTTALAFTAFLAAGSAELTRFGLIGAVTVMAVFVVAGIAHPAVVWAALRLGWRPLPAKHGGGTRARFWERAGVGLALVVETHRRALVLIASAAAIVAGLAFAQLDPGFAYAEQAPVDAPSVRALATLAERLDGGATIQLALPITLVGDADDPVTLAGLRAAHEAAAAALPQALVLSPWSLIDWLNETGRPVTRASLDALLAAAPEPWRGLVLSADGTTPALLAVVEGDDPSRLLDAAGRLETAVGDVLGTDVANRATGAVLLAAHRSGEVISRLGFGLALAAVGAAALVATAFRSARLFPVVVLPNILPVALVGAIVFAAGADLRLASALALTIALGIAVDGTVHVLNTYERRPPRPRAALVRTLRELLPVLVITTLVLVLGMAPALASWSPGVATFALFAIVTLVVALLADVVLLPALLAAARIRPVHDQARSPLR